LLSEVNKQRVKNLERSLIEKYNDDKKQSQNQTTSKTQEWQTIIDKYSFDDPSLDIRKTDSLLYRISKKFYEDSELSKEYAGKGGMMKAVADAFIEATRLINKKKKSPKEKKLERKLSKEKSKNALSAIGKKKGKTASTKPKYKNDFDEYVAERKKQKAGMMGL